MPTLTPQTHPTWTGLVAPDRDRWGRPVINGVPHTRASTMASTLSDASGLTDWKVRTAMRAVATTDSLRDRVATCSDDDKHQMRELQEQALTLGGGTSAASTGTAIHSATEMADRGQDLTGLPDNLRRAADAYTQALTDHDLAPMDTSTGGLAAEGFVVNAALETAGSFDRIIQHLPTQNTAVLDIKTGARTHKEAARYAMPWAIQTAIYAQGVPYCNDRGLLTWQDLGHTNPPSVERGVICHINITNPTKPIATLLMIDLTAGWDLALTCAAVRANRKNAKTLILDVL